MNIAELRQKAKLPAVKAGGSVVSQFFEANRATIMAVLPKHMTPQRMMKIALGAIRQTPQLMECSTESLFGAVVLSAQLGLEPNTPLGHAYLIPFRNKKKGTTEVTFIAGYKGLIDLARRSGQIVSISSHAVRENDFFEFEYGLDERLRHIPAKDNPGEIIAFYAVAKLQGGGHQFEVMWRHQVDAIRDSSNGYRAALNYAKRNEQGQITYLKHPWFEHYEEMGRKTTVRRLTKYLPMSIEFATAAALDGMAEAGESQGLDQVLQGEYTVENRDADKPETRPIAQIVADIRDCTDAGALDALRVEAEMACDGDQDLWLDVQTMLTDRSEELKKATA